MIEQPVTCQNRNLFQHAQPSLHRHDISGAILVPGSERLQRNQAPGTTSDAFVICIEATKDEFAEEISWG
jgi:hypothetical protein